MTSVSVCVTCRARPADPRCQPFCSERCKLIDLERWLSGDYRVPGPASAEPPLPGGDADAEDLEVDDHASH